MAAGELGEAFAVGFDQACAGFTRAVQELAHAGVAARGLVIDFDDGLRRGLQTHAYGVKAEENFGGRHSLGLSGQAHARPVPGGIAARK
ncbi:hypothetical protein D3C78_1337450 [compost metagenome]